MTSGVPPPLFAFSTNAWTVAPRAPSATAHSLNSFSCPPALLSVPSLVKITKTGQRSSAFLKKRSSISSRSVHQHGACAVGDQAARRLFQLPAIGGRRHAHARLASGRDDQHLVLGRQRVEKRDRGVAQVREAGGRGVARTQEAR